MVPKNPKCALWANLGVLRSALYAAQAAGRSYIEPSDIAIALDDNGYAVACPSSGEEYSLLQVLCNDINSCAPRIGNKRITGTSGMTPLEMTCFNFIWSHSESQRTGTQHAVAIDLLRAINRPRQQFPDHLRRLSSERRHAVLMLLAAAAMHTNADMHALGYADTGYARSDRWNDASLARLAKTCGLLDLRTGKPSRRFNRAWQWLLANEYLVSKRVGQRDVSYKMINWNRLMDLHVIDEAMLREWIKHSAERNSTAARRTATPARHIRQKYCANGISPVLRKLQKRAMQKLRSICPWWEGEGLSAAALILALSGPQTA